MIKLKKKHIKSLTIRSIFSLILSFCLTKIHVDYINEYMNSFEKFRLMFILFIVIMVFTSKKVITWLITLADDE